MASYYLSHHDNSTTTTTATTATTPQEIPENANLHTLILMQQHQQQQSNNILLLNSAAAAAAFSHPPPHQFHHQFTRPDHQNITLYGYPQEETREVTRARQGLSLSLNSQNNPGVGGGDADVAGTDGGQVSVLGSKYLRAAQELLEQVVNVGDTLTTNNPNTNNNTPKNFSTDGTHSPGKGKGKGKGVGDTPPSNGGGTQLTTSERQEIQMKKAKLVSMLDEAEQRYRHYNNQMQMIIESFERAAGMGSAKTYTALALKTISKQFRCLKDAIQAQIRVANKSLGEDDGGVGSTGGKIQGSRLKFIDHQIRQQRALQQLGMIQNHNAWRPQRGLPERSVSVLRAWLFEHFLHPYPKDSDKILLAKQTGLTRSQVSNWFINARVRLWKPMIEEMYTEELKDHEQNNSENKENSNEDIDGASNSIIEQEKFNSNGDQNQLNNSAYHQHGFTLTGSLEMEGIVQGSPKRQRSNNQVVNNNNNNNNNNGEILIKFGNSDEKEEGNNVYPMISGGMNFMGGGELGIGSYPMNDLGRFETEDFPTPRFVQGNNGGISLSLGVGLPPCDNNNHHQQQQHHFNHHSFMSSNQNISFPRGNDFGSIDDIQNRKGFAAQLLPDFVA